MDKYFDRFVGCKEDTDHYKHAFISHFSYKHTLRLQESAVVFARYYTADATTGVIRPPDEMDGNNGYRVKRTYPPSSTVARICVYGRWLVDNTSQHDQDEGVAAMTYTFLEGCVSGAEDPDWIVVDRYFSRYKH